MFEERSRASSVEVGESISHLISSNNFSRLSCFVGDISEKKFHTRKGFSKGKSIAARGRSKTISLCLRQCLSANMTFLRSHRGFYWVCFRFSFQWAPAPLSLLIPENKSLKNSRRLRLFEIRWEKLLKILLPHSSWRRGKKRNITRPTVMGSVGVDVIFHEWASIMMIHQDWQCPSAKNEALPVHSSIN